MISKLDNNICIKYIEVCEVSIRILKISYLYNN